MTNCPCCSNPMLRHIRQNQMYWFCRSCWQEMPLVHTGLSVVPASLEWHFQPQGLPRSLVTA